MTPINNANGPHRGAGRVLNPLSGAVHAGDLGVRAHTLYKIFIPNAPTAEEIKEAKAHPNSQPVAGYNAETPQSLACLYGEYDPDCRMQPGDARSPLRTSTGGRPFHRHRRCLRLPQRPDRPCGILLQVLASRHYQLEFHQGVRIRHEPRPRSKLRRRKRLELLGRGGGAGY